MIIRHEFQLPHLKHGIQSAKVLFASVANLSKPPLSKLSSKGWSAVARGAKIRGTSYETVSSTRHDEEPLGKNRTEPLQCKKKVN